MTSQTEVDNKIKGHIQIATDNVEKVIKAIKENNYTLSSEEVLSIRKLQILIKKLRYSLIMNELMSGVPENAIAAALNNLTPAKISQIKRR